MNTKQEQHQPSNNSTNQTLFSHNICSLCKLKNAGYTFRPNAVYKHEEPRSANGNSAFRSSKTRHWEWRFPAHLGCLACCSCCSCWFPTDRPVKAPIPLAPAGQIANCVGAFLQQVTSVDHAWTRQLQWRFPCRVRAKRAPPGK